jgi:nucleotide sugar dehydrogenase
MKICIIGNGYVGKAMVELLNDKYLISIKEIEDNYDFVDNSDLAIVCVPTEMKEDGSCDTSIVEKVIKESDAPYYLIKSTVPPGTTLNLSHKYKKRIVFSPEYVGEGNYPIPPERGIPNPTNIKLHGFQIFGGQKEHCNYMIDIFTPILGPYCKYMKTDSTTAELVKYMENTYLATKLTFCHEFYRIVNLFGRDYNEIRELFLLDKRCEPGHTAVFNGELGFSGKCLPKDISGIYTAAKERGFDSKFLKQVMDTNEELKDETKKDR